MATTRAMPPMPDAKPAPSATAATVTSETVVPSTQPSSTSNTSAAATIQSTQGATARTGKEDEDEDEDEYELPADATLEETLAFEHDALVSLVGEHHVEAFTDAFCRVTSHASYYRRLTATLHFVEGYPATPLVVHLASEALPPKVLARLQGLAEKAAIAAAPGPQVLSAFTAVHTIVQENKLLYATPEVRQLAMAVQQPGEAQHTKVTANEKTGTVRLRTTRGKFSLVAKITVPNAYPAEELELEFQTCSFPKQLSEMYRLQAKEISRKSVLGFDPAKALDLSDAVKTGSGLAALATGGGGRGGGGVKKKDLKGGAGGGPPVVAALTTNYVNSLKHDVNFLKKAKDLREVDQGFKKRIKEHTNSTETRRRARRELRKLSEAEFAAERQLLAQLAEAEQNEMANQRSTAEGAQAPQRCLRFIVLEFLAHRFVRDVPLSKCVHSHKPLFPVGDPAAMEKRLTQGKKVKDRPVRSTCGCWYTFGALEEVMCNPPFGQECEGCKGRVTHSAFSRDLKVLEQEWAKSKAREREVNEALDFLDLGDKFRR